MNGITSRDVLVPILLTVAAAGLTTVALPRWLSLLERAALVQTNYRGHSVPASCGIIITFIYASVLVVWQAVMPSTVLHALLFVTVAMSFVGFTDDVLGDKSAQGLRGHARLLLRGGLSTGGLKAVFGTIVSFGAAALLTDGWPNVALGTISIALACNTVNLFDLRPGRAVKGTVLVGVFVLMASANTAAWTYVAPLLASLVVYVPHDLRARAMLGDAGSNAIGGVLGVTAFASLSPGGRIVWVLFLIAVHVLAERGSISRTIERIPALKWLDQWGRD